jgi:hypothetical protein
VIGKLNLLPFLNLNMDLRGKKDGTSKIEMPPERGITEFNFLV